MRKRRNERRGLIAGAARLAVTASLRLWAKIMRRPLDSFAIMAAVAASAVILVNALALQPRARLAPFIVNAPSSPPADAASSMPAEPRPPMHSAETMPSIQTIAARRDPIAQLIGISSRIMAVQRVLAAYGYGQIRPSGVLDGPTSAAIEKFERARKLPVTGRISERLVNDLAAMVGHPLE